MRPVRPCWRRKPQPDAKVVALFAVLALVLLGVVIGARGMRRLGGSLRGPWKPGVTALALLSAFGALAMLARGDWWIAMVLGFLAAGCLAAARRARPVAVAPRGMSRAEAADLLGVSPDATRTEAEAAFRRLILKLHPDQGGTAGLSARLQEARRVMAQPVPAARRR